MSAEMISNNHSDHKGEYEKEPEDLPFFIPGVVVVV